MSRGLRRVLASACAVLVLALSYVGVHVGQVHKRSFEYRWSPSAAAPKIQLAGRSYLRAERLPRLPSGEVELGVTEGGGHIYGRPAGPYAPTVIHVVAGNDTFEYALSGGP